MTKEEKKAAKILLAKELFARGANCSQAAAGAFAAECGLTEEAAFRLASGFGGGVARMREVCGALSGMFMVLGFLKGNGNIEDKKAKDAFYGFLQKQAEKFRSQAGGSIICRELLQGSGNEKAASCRNPESEERSSAYYKKRPCSELVALAVSLTVDALEE